MINLVVCSHCRLVLCSDFQTRALPDLDSIVGLKILPQPILVAKEQSPAFSQENYDYYCFYFELVCSQCSARIGKHYITFNNYLIKNAIFSILELSKINFLCFDPISESGNNPKTSDSRSTTDSDQKTVSPHAKVKDPFSETEVLAEFLSSMRVLQKLRMREAKARISSLEEKLRCLLGVNCGLDN